MGEPGLCNRYKGVDAEDIPAPVLCWKEALVPHVKKEQTSEVKLNDWKKILSNWRRNTTRFGPRWTRSTTLLFTNCYQKSVPISFPSAFDHWTVNYRTIDGILSSQLAARFILRMAESLGVTPLDHFLLSCRVLRTTLSRAYMQQFLKLQRVTAVKTATDLVIQMIKAQWSRLGNLYLDMGADMFDRLSGCMQSSKMVGLELVANVIDHPPRILLRNRVLRT